MGYNPSDAAKAISKAKDSLISSGKEHPAKSLYSTEYASVVKAQTSLFGKIIPTEWYQIFPYQFVVIDAKNDPEKKSGDRYIYSLPIPPESIQLSMVPASRATATLGGVVEETSENVFWQINMSGTTGIAIGKQNNDVNPATIFRSTISTTGLLSGLGAAVQQVFGQAQNIVNSVTSGGSIGGSVAGLLSGVTQPPLPYSKSSVNNTSNGYSEINSLHKFLFAYSALKDREPNRWFLYFINHKQDQKMRISLKGFNIQQSAQEPYLYRYRISIQGWDMQSAKGFTQKNVVDRFKGDLKTVNTLTLTGIASSTGNLVGTIMGGKSIAGALKIVPSVL